MTAPLVDDRAAPVLATRALRLRRGTREVLQGVDLTVDRGEVLALMGLSGSGKTTILRAVAGLEPFDGGEIQVEAVTITAGTPFKRVRALLHQRVAMVFQFHYLFEHLSVLENIGLAPVHVQRRPRHEVESRARQLLEQLGVAGRAHALPRELSGGEAQRVAIARALAVNPPVLLLDEPTASLDPARRSELGESLSQLAREGRTLLLTSHDAEFVRDFATRVIVLAEGSIVEAGAPHAVLENPQHRATRELLQTERPRR